MRMRLPPLPTVGEIIRLYRLRAKKHLSQNFLLDLNLTKKIVCSAGKLDNGFVCEVGPGPGGITRSLLETNLRQLVVIEKDRRFVPGLQLLADAAEGRMAIVHGDILLCDLSSVIPQDVARPWEDNSPNIHLIGNLPFNVSTPLIIRWLEEISNKTGPWKFGRTKLTLTFQKEVAERMVARTLSKQRCRLSVMCQNLCDIHLKFIIPGKAFVPPPKVDVAVVQFIPRVKPMINHPFKLVEKVCRHLFHFRNKHCKHTLATLFPPDMPELTAEMLEETGINPETRSYMLSMGDMSKFCDTYRSICDRIPFMLEYNYRDPENIKKYHNKRIMVTEMLEDRILNDGITDDEDVLSKAS
ncbi:dimethyladenosine transferase 1, mitochondrial-like [Gigantopelta aegis]|uniref:dimethyladenosine transferase 1, mitochondrial-like n=1 Tax=Gigantopelta aegis TaxID=1735272 RepID=UPI001B887C5F|nr:dimethyladenosine transferase 1, mitochondrial-like [Gigantopelta aegis]XP_041358413.1 dimethyladenosine transferase 1, mitochondrial-like [Gigantopelta aegis]